MQLDSSASRFSLTQAVRAEAHRLGFRLVGVTTPEPPASLAVFENWLSEGRHGEMNYLADERGLRRRADPHLVLPQCQSILVLGMPYPASSAEHNQDEESKGKIASYAWGMDYHPVITKKLKMLVAFLESQTGMDVPSRWYTDTGPILERDLAQRAGLGWIGKNSCLINPALGSYFFLAEIFLGIDLVIDRPFLTDRCGTCTRCLEACPTGCILPNRTLDARRCLAYLTIELKGAIPAPLRPLLGEWIFGCDVCQQVCPWNIRFAPKEVDQAFSPRPDLITLGLQQALSLTGEAFSRLFKGSPIKRAKRGGFLRNAVIVLGNRRDPEMLPALTHAFLGDPDPLVRGHAAWALTQVDPQAARPILRQAERLEMDPFVREEILRALS
jgi:epoxyqueuosine reductase